jgi:anti-sigma factor RsiW
MSGNDSSHPDAEALERYRGRTASAAETLAVDAHIAQCDRCHDAVRAESDIIELPPPDGDTHLTYAELEAFVDGRAEALDRELIAAHAASCARCSSELTDLAATRDSLASRSPGAPRPVRFRRPRP